MKRLSRKNHLNKLNKLNEKELVILRKAIDESEKVRGKKQLESSTIKKIISILEAFLRKKKFICYGGTALNNILPHYDQFYNKDIELPDYDFFTPNAMEDAKELADLYYNKGFDEVEAKAGVHGGTFKVFVNFIPIADVTQLDPEIYKVLKKDAITIKGINYASPNFLRMNAYLELSRPAGDTSRWEKVFKRLSLLNKHYPINQKKCDVSEFIRKFTEPNPKSETIYNTIKNSIIKQSSIFFGGFALYAYGKYLPENQRKKLIQYPDFDILANDAKTAAETIVKELNKKGINNTSIIEKEGFGEIVAPHYDVRVGDESVVFVYTPLACHSYNTIKINSKTVKIATIDTMLTFYLAFLYAKREYYDPERILCIAQYLFYIQTKNRLKQDGVLKRFSINCYGKQQTLENIRGVKAEKYKEFKNNKTSKEYQKYFLRYYPLDKYTNKKPYQKKTNKKKNQKKRKTQKRKTQKK